MPVLPRHAWWSALVLALAASACHPNRSAETVTCAAGEPIWVGCSAACDLGSCWGNPALLVCDGDVSIDDCNDDNAIGANDDAAGICFGSCPVLRTVCPASGHVTVTVRHGRGDFACDWGIASRPLLDGDVADASASEDAASEDAASEDAASEDAASEDASATEDAASGDASASDGGDAEDGG